jgi:proline dehydrogenase
MKIENNDGRSVHTEAQDPWAKKTAEQRQGDPDFSNTEIAFKGLSDKALYQTWLIFSSFRSRILVTQGPKLAQSLMKFPLFGKSLVAPLIEKTIFGQFCGGSSLESSLPRVKDLARWNVGSVLDYSVEGLGREEDFEEAFDEISKTIQFARDNQPQMPLAVFKASGMISSALLEKKSSHKTLTLDEEKLWERGIKRFDQLFAKAHSLKVRLMVDAEETWIQPAIDEIVYGGMKKYNRTEPIVYNTLQMYLADRLEHMEQKLKETEGYYLGFKIVRGAYMEKERLWAQSQGQKSPILGTKSEVDKAFDQAVKLGLENLKNCALVIGTHNEASSLNAVQLMKRCGIDRIDKNIVFSQLLGMSDHLSFNLSHHGYRVAKYVPYGPVEAVMPYLGRRAEENSSIHGQIGRELGLIQKEILRRKRLKQ